MLTFNLPFGYHIVLLRLAHTLGTILSDGDLHYSATFLFSPGPNLSAMSFQHWAMKIFHPRPQQHRMLYIYIKEEFIPENPGANTHFQVPVGV